MSATRAKYRYRRLACDSPANASFRFSKLLVPLRLRPAIGPPCWSTGGTAGAPAGAAAAVELTALHEYLEPGPRRDPGPGGAGVRSRNVVDAPARHAGEVVVGRRVAVEAHAAEIGALDEQPLGGEHPQIAVDRGQAHAGQPAADLSVDDGGRGMGVGAAHGVEDDPARPCEPLAARVERGSVGVVGSRPLANHSQEERAGLYRRVFLVVNARAGPSREAAALPG